MVLLRGGAWFRLTALAVTCAVLLASQLYYAYNQNNVSFGFSTLLFGVVVPLVVGCIILLLTKQLVLLLAFVGLFWSIVDDAPVYFDSVFTWPAVTRFNPFLPHLEMEILLHLLTLGFLMGAIWLNLRGRHLAGRRLLLPYALAFIAFLLSYAQNIPLDPVQDLVEQSWYQLDLVEHIASSFVLGLALFVGRDS